jgi:D-psicose/D-tagatose/L-ribulose 3-epimerase
MIAGRRPEEENKSVTGIEMLERMEHLGFDYIELSLADIMNLSEQEFSGLERRLSSSPLNCEACHNFIPSKIRLTGPNADLGRALEYARRAFARVARLGTEIVVFGSSGARNVPQGYAHQKALRQLVDLLKRMGDLAAGQGITVVFEPLNRSESNIVNTHAEALDLIQQASHSHIKLLCDYYHLMLESESPNIIAQAGRSIRHVHFSEPERRSFPSEAKESYRIFFQKLKEIGYRSRVSIEAFAEDFEKEAPLALEVLRDLSSG